MQGLRRGPLDVRRPLLWLGTAASLSLVLDQVTKRAVSALLPVNESVPVIRGVLDIARVENAGAAFGLLPGQQYLFVIISLLMLAGVAVYWLRERPRAWPVAIALGLVVGGALGNLIDRVFIGRVTDFLAFSFFAPVFNVADSAIVIGVGVLVVWMFVGWREEGAGEEEAPETEPQEAPPTTLPTTSSTTPDVHR